MVSDLPEWKLLTVVQWAESLIRTSLAFGSSTPETSTSPSLQAEASSWEEFIELMGDGVLLKIASEVKMAKYFAHFHHALCITWWPCSRKILEISPQMDWGIVLPEETIPITIE